MKLVYFVIIAILFTSAVNAQSSSITTDRSATGFSVPVRIVDPNGEARAAEERAEAQRRDAITNKHDTEDLIAQQKAANAAERSASSSDTQVSIGWLQLAVSLIGFIALLATLLLNRRATDAAVKATNAALEANKFAQSQFIVDQRPWLRLERPVISLKEHRNTFAIGLEIEAFNVGKTPAIEAELHFDVKFTQLAPPSVEGVQRFARQIMKPTEWRDAHKIVFPNANRPFDEVIVALQLTMRMPT
jgi:hypothetical protein